MPEFGNLTDGRPLWVADFGRGREEVLFYDSEHGHWWLGSMDGTSSPEWTLVSRANFGDLGTGGLFGALRPRLRWIGRFANRAGRDVLFYADDGRWWLGTLEGNELRWADVTDPDRDFGNLRDGRPFWVGSFKGWGDQLMFVYTDADGHNDWWLGTVIDVPGGRQLVWNPMGSTGFGNVADGRPIWAGDFTGDHRADLMFYSPADQNWWLGTPEGVQLAWHHLGNRARFGQLWDGRPLWTGKFAGAEKQYVLFHNPADGSWWLGGVGQPTPSTYALDWIPSGVARFGDLNDGRPIWFGGFGGARTTQILFYYHPDGAWYRLDFTGARLSWSLTTAPFGDLQKDHLYWTGSYVAGHGTSLLFYDCRDRLWWLGTVTGSTLAWKNVTDHGADFGKIDDGRPIWVGDFLGNGTSQVLFYYRADGSWWRGRMGADRLEWQRVSDTGAAPDEESWFEGAWDGVRTFVEHSFEGAGKVAAVTARPFVRLLELGAAVFEWLGGIPIFGRLARWRRRIGTAGARDRTRP